MSITLKLTPTCDSATQQRDSPLPVEFEIHNNGERVTIKTAMMTKDYDRVEREITFDREGIDQLMKLLKD